MTAYNMTLLQSATSIYDIATYANSVTNDLTFLLLSLAAYIIIIVSLKRFEFINAFTATNFVMFIVTSLLALAGLVNIVLPVTLLVLTALSAVVLVFT